MRNVFLGFFIGCVINFSFLLLGMKVRAMQVRVVGVKESHPNQKRVTVVVQFHVRLPNLVRLLARDQDRVRDRVQHHAQRLVPNRVLALDLVPSRDLVHALALNLVPDLDLTPNRALDLVLAPNRGLGRIRNQCRDRGRDHVRGPSRNQVVDLRVRLQDLLNHDHRPLPSQDLRPQTRLIKATPAVPVPHVYRMLRINLISSQAFS